MSKFKVGDKVRRKPSHMNTGGWLSTCARSGLNPSDVYTVKNANIDFVDISFIGRDYIGRVYTFDADRFDAVNSIKVGDVYKNGNGDEIRIVCVDRKNADFKVIGLLAAACDIECVKTYTENGKYRSDCVESIYDLILPWNEPKTDWKKVAVDTLIRVTHNGVMSLRYFSHYNGHVVFFANGATSRTALPHGVRQVALATDCEIVKE